jgi:hypothetical protein
MGGAVRVEFLLEALEEGLDRYRAQQADGADMAQAGAELFSYVEDVKEPRPCSPNRYSYSTLAMVVRNNDPEHLKNIKETILKKAVPGQVPGQDVQQLVAAIDERIALLRETDPFYPRYIVEEPIAVIPLDDYDDDGIACESSG